MSNYTREETLEFFDANAIPDDFDQWGEMMDGGIPVAHAAAERGILPPNFTNWALRAPDGRTVAHYWGKERPMPDGFEQYGLTDGYGNSVQEICEARNLNEQSELIREQASRPAKDTKLRQEVIAPRPGTFRPFI